MADVLVTGIKIGDMPLKGTVSGNEKLPTGDVGDLAVTPNQIKDFTIQEGNLVNQEQLDDAIESVEQTSSGLAGRVQTLENKTSNINNTADLDKPISNATQAALNAKADKVDVDAKLDLKADKDKVVSSFNGQTGAVTLDQSDLVDVGGNFTATPIFQNVPKLTKPDGSSIPEIDSQIQPLVNSLAVHRQGLTPTFDQAFADTIGGYPLNARIMLDNGDIVKSTVANNTTNPNVDMTGWEIGLRASLVIDSSGKSQQQINDAFVSLVKTEAQPFTDFATAIDAAPIIQAYANALNEGDTLHIPHGKFAIKTACVINKAINIKCDGELVVSGDTASVFRLEQAPAFTLTGSDLTQLPKKGDTKLYVSGAPFDSAEYFFALVSTESEIVRIGYADPYYKNETLAFIDSSFNVRGQIDLDYTDASKLTIYVYKKRRPTNVQLRMSMQPNVGQTTDARILEAVGVNNICWDVFIDRSTSQKVAGISFLYSRCVNFTMLPTSKILGGQSDTTDSYAFLNIASSYIIHFGGEYTDQGNTTKKERGYAGRHGKYVYFYASSFNGIDDHFGHHYFVYNINFLNRGIGISGGELYVENCRQYSPTEPLVQLRTDTPYADGKLTMRNCYAKVALLGASSVNNASYNSKYKAWDEILIDDCEIGLQNIHAIIIGTFYTQNENFRTNRMEIRNLKYKRSSTSTGRFLNTGGQDAFVDDFIINGLYSLDGVLSDERMVFAVMAAKSITLKQIPDGIDGLFKAPKIKIDDDVKIGYSVTQPVILIGTQSLNISNSNISNDASSYTSTAEQGAINLLNNEINTAKFFGNGFLNAAISSGFGNKVNVNIGFQGDLRNYQKTKPYRYVSIAYTIPALALGATTPIQTSDLPGVRFGDDIDASFVPSAMNGLEIKRWVSASDKVSWYIENPANNPVGAFSGASVSVRFNARSI